MLLFLENEMGKIIEHAKVYVVRSFSLFFSNYILTSCDIFVIYLLF